MATKVVARPGIRHRKRLAGVSGGFGVASERTRMMLAGRLNAIYHLYLRCGAHTKHGRRGYVCARAREREPERAREQDGCVFLITFENIFTYELGFVDARHHWLAQARHLKQPDPRQWLRPRARMLPTGTIFLPSHQLISYDVSLIAIPFPGNGKA